VAGTQWVQDEVLAKYPNADVRVYMIWLPVYGGDSPAAWDQTLLDDPRVIHYWDGERLVGSWFYEHGSLDGEGTVYNAYWDRYIIYSPSAVWENDAMTENSLGTAFPIVAGTDSFLQNIDPFLNG